MTTPGLEEALTDPRTEEIFRRMREKNAIGHKGCPWCGDVPHCATQGSFGWYIVACEGENCPVEPMASGKTLSEAWARWDSRKPETAEPMHDPDMNISEPRGLL